ncbi:Hint domain-containing protein [Halocynthiibacter sp.]|uniref:Hint domain-containing protein n=1 Tax=Halocynthiibacter sp. TaxID=1979210 RepID=UPI003C3AF949
MSSIDFGRTTGTIRNGFDEVSNSSDSSVQLSNGNMVYVWRDNGLRVGELPVQQSLFMRIVRPDGTSTGDIKINQYEGSHTDFDNPPNNFGGVSLTGTTEFGYNRGAAVSISESASGGINVFYHSKGQAFADDPANELRDAVTLYARSFDADGNATAAQPNGGNEIRLEPTGTLANPDGADAGGSTHTRLLDNGNTLVTWIERNEEDVLTWKTMVLDANLNTVSPITEHFPVGDAFDPSQSPAPAIAEFDQMRNIDSEELSNGNILFTGQGRFVGNGFTGADDYNEAELYSWVINPSTNDVVSGPTRVSPVEDFIHYTSEWMDVDPTTGNPVLFSYISGGFTRPVVVFEFGADGALTGSKSIDVDPETPAGLSGTARASAFAYDGGGNLVHMYVVSTNSPGTTETVVSKIYHTDGTVTGPTVEYQTTDAFGFEQASLYMKEDGTFQYTATANITAGNGQNHSEQWGGAFNIAGATAPPPPSDGIVSGTSGADVIDTSYTGDPDGDKVDSNDAVNGHFGAADGSNDDYIQAGGGNDEVYAGAGADHVEGGSGHDEIYGEGGNDNIDGGTGNDDIDGGTGNDTILAGDGDDTITGGAGNDTMEGGRGDDTFILANGFGTDTIDGDTGQQNNGGDAIDASAITGDITLDLSQNGAADQESGTLTRGGNVATFEEIERITLGSGDDTVIGSSGNDTNINLGTGADTFTGGAGNDSADLGSDNDTDTIVLNNGDGNDTFTSFSGPTSNGAGGITIPTGIDQLDVGGLTKDGTSGTDPINVTDIDPADVTVSGSNITINFPDGTTVTLEVPDTSVFTDPDTRVAALVAIGIPPAPADGIVSGTSGDDIIDKNYEGDPHGDKVDNSDAVNNHFGANDGSNDDYIQAGAGNDTINSANGNDHIEAGTGNDTVNAGKGNDNVDGGAGDDNIDGAGGHDIIDGGAGDDTIKGGGSNDTLTGGDGDDSFIYTNNYNRDTIVGGEGAEDNGGDVLDATGMTANATLDLRHDGDDIGTNAVNTGGIDDNESGRLYRSNTHRVDFQEVEKFLLGSGDDQVFGSNAGDTVHTGDGDDTVDAADGNDHITTGGGNDTVDLGAGDDTVVISTGTNALTGGTGTDTLEVDDSATGPIVVNVDDLGDGTSVLDGGTSTLDGIENFVGLDTGDTDSITLTTLVTDRTTISGIDTTAAVGTYTPDDGSGAIAFGGPGEPTLASILANSGSKGSISITDGDESGTIGNISFSEMETINFNIDAVCVARGSGIMTDMGEVLVEDLTEGMHILTMDNGYQELRWIGSRTVPAQGKLAPVRVRAGTLGADRDLYLSQQHRILLQGYQAELLFGEDEVLVPAKALVNDCTISIQSGAKVEYYHLMFDQHEIVFSNGMATESFFPGGTAMSALEHAAQEEVLSLFPELAMDVASYGSTARPSVPTYVGTIIDL